MRKLAWVLLWVAVAGAPALAGDRADERDRLVGEIVSLSEVLPPDLRPGAEVLAAMRTVPRHRFVPEGQQAAAYENRPLPIGHGQTISQPTVVAVMTQLLALRPSARVLEIGTGSGYQAAILAALGAKVWSIEIIEPLSRAAAQRLDRLRYDVGIRVGDGYHGWPEEGPFDGIIVTAAASHLPPPLIRQLKPGGRMVIPVGEQFMVQHLTLVEKANDGRLTVRQLLPVRFVPLTGGAHTQ